MEAYFILTSKQVLIWRDHYQSFEDAEELAAVLRHQFNRPVSIILDGTPKLKLPPLPWDEELSTSDRFNYPV